MQLETIIQEDSPNKKPYPLTREGRKELQKWLAEPGKPTSLHNPFLAQLHFSDAIPVEAQLDVMEARLATLKAEIKELERRAD